MNADQDTSVATNENSVEPSPPPNDALNCVKNWRYLVAFWILGLCNNYGYVVMLTGAEDILKKTYASDDEDDTSNNTLRDCNVQSTGAILLADILPSLAIKLIAPFLPFLIHVRMAWVVALSAGSFLLVALATAQWMAILGVICTSLSSGLGEVTLLSYSASFERNVISTWSSGTGGAGILGSFSYAGLIHAGLTPQDTVLLMLIVPALMALAFWVILIHPSPSGPGPGQRDSGVRATVLQSLRKNMKIVPSMGKYFIPLGLVYFFEYFTNQGLFELVRFDNFWLDKAQQYRWLQVDYQVGVFISRSSVNLIHILNIWAMAICQFVVAFLLLFHALFFYIPSFWIIFTIVFCEGLIGGAAYVNTFYKMAKEVPEEQREFSMGIIGLADAIGPALAGVVAMPVHNAICQLPKPV